MGKHSKDKDSKPSSSIDDQPDTRKLVTSSSRSNSHDHASATALASREGSKKHSHSHSHQSKERDKEREKGRDRDRERNGDGQYDEEQGGEEDEYPSTPSKSIHRLPDKISTCMRFMHNQVRAKMILSAALIVLVLYEVLFSGTYSASGILEAMNRDRDRAMIKSAASQFLNIVGNGQISADTDISIDMGDSRQGESEQGNAKEIEETAQKILSQEEHSEMQMPDSVRNPALALGSSPPAIPSSSILDHTEKVDANGNGDANQPVVGESMATNGIPPILGNGNSIDQGQGQVFPGNSNVPHGERVIANLPPGVTIIGQEQATNEESSSTMGTQSIPLMPQTPSEPQGHQEGIPQVPPPALQQESLGSGYQNALQPPPPPPPPILTQAQGAISQQIVPSVPIAGNGHNLAIQSDQNMPPPALQQTASNTVPSQPGIQPPPPPPPPPPVAINSNPSNTVYMNPTQESASSIGTAAVPPMVASAGQDAGSGSGDVSDMNSNSGDTASSSKTKKGSFMEWFVDSTSEETEGTNETCTGVEDRLKLLLCKSMSKFMRKYKVRRIVDGNCEFTQYFVPVMIANFARDYWGFKYICISQDTAVFDRIRASGLLKESESVLFLEGMWWKPVDLKDNIGIDMYFMYDVLAHASYGRVWSFFSAGKQSGIKYFVFDNYPAISNDPSPDRKLINVRRYPFKFDRAKDTVNNVTEAGEDPEQVVRQLVLYTVDQLPDRL